MLSCVGSPSMGRQAWKSRDRGGDRRLKRTTGVKLYCPVAQKINLNTWSDHLLSRVDATDCNCIPSETKNVSDNNKKRIFSERCCSR